MPSVAITLPDTIYFWIPDFRSVLVGIILSYIALATFTFYYDRKMNKTGEWENLNYMTILLAYIIYPYLLKLWIKYANERQAKINNRDKE